MMMMQINFFLTSDVYQIKRIYDVGQNTFIGKDIGYLSKILCNEGAYYLMKISQIPLKKRGLFLMKKNREIKLVPVSIEREK